MRRSPSEYQDFYSPLSARIHGSILDSAGDAQGAIDVLEAGLSVAKDRGDPYESALLTLTLDRVSQGRIDAGELAEARNAPHIGCAERSRIARQRLMSVTSAGSGSGHSRRSRSPGAACIPLRKRRPGS